MRNFGYIVLNEQLENAALVGERSKEHQVGNCWTMSVDGELSNLGRTIIAYRGHSTRVMNELEPYFSEQFASDEVVERHSSLVSIFEKLKRASSEWFHLTERPADKQRISRDYAKDVYLMELFENKYKEWLDRVYTPVRRELYGKGTVNISGVDLNLKTPVVPSEERRQELQNVNIEASYVTNISEVQGAGTSNVIQNTSIHDTAPDQTRSRVKGFSQGSESCARDVKRAMAQLKVRELQEVQAIKESEIELRLREENMRVLAERERLQLRSQLMQAKIDAERAELEASFRERVGDGSVTTPADLCVSVRT